MSNAPRTLFDEIECERAHMQDHARVDREEDPVGQRVADKIEQLRVDGKFSWRSLVRRLREENTSLLDTIKSIREDLRQSHRDKAELEKKFERHIQLSEMTIQDLKLKLEVQKSDTREKIAGLQIELDATKAENEKLTADLEVQRERIRALESSLRHEEEEMDKRAEDKAYEEDIEALKTHLQEVEDRYTIEHKKRMQLMFQKRYLLLTNRALEECEMRALNGQDIKEPRSPASKWRACFAAIIATHRLRKLTGSS
ncbi:hypothetical protein BX666DRAFT_123228 [Dichotomocladium elegans]|nr:hypothetical protein BX666DRAFT_123228 [Dichotomocladium elegans]